MLFWIVARHRLLQAACAATSLRGIIVKHHTFSTRHVLAERGRARQALRRRPHIGALALEIVGDGAAQGRVGDVMRRIGGDRQIAARELVLALGAGLDAQQPCAIAKSIAW